MSIGVLAHKDKIGELLVYLVTKIPNINLRKLLKLVYLIDETSVKRKVLPITWLEYVAWAKGPVSVELYDIKDFSKNIFSDYVYSERSKDDQVIIKTQRNKADLDSFSAIDMNIIDEVLKEYTRYTEEQLSELTHTHDRIWNEVVSKNNISFIDNSKSDFVVDFRMMLSDEDVSYYNDAEENVKLCAYLNH